MFMDCCPSQDTQQVKLVLLSLLTQGFLSLSSLNVSMFHKYTALKCSDSTLAVKAAQSSLQQVRRQREGPRTAWGEHQNKPYCSHCPSFSLNIPKMTDFTTEPSSKGSEPAEFSKATLTFLYQLFLPYSPLISLCSSSAQLHPTLHLGFKPMAQKSL